MNNHSTLETTGPGVFESLRRHIALIVITTLLVSGATAFLVSRRHAQYEATAQLLFAPAGPELQVLNTSTPQSNDPKSAAATNVAVVQAMAIDRLTARRVGTTTGELRTSVKVAQAGQSNVVNVGATASTLATATARADAVARLAVARLRDQQRSRARQAMDVLRPRYNALTRRQKRTGEGATMRQQLLDLDALERLGTGSPRLIQRAAQQTSRVDKPKQLIALGVVFGLLLGAALALLRERSDRRLRGGGDIADALDVPVLASVGRSRAVRKGVPFGALPDRDAEAFRFLYARLRFGDSSARPRTVMVTSAREGEGKTAIAVNLAGAAAAAGSRVLLIEADFRRPMIAERLGVAATGGLHDVLRSQATLEDAVVRPPDPPGVLDVLVAGAQSGDASLLLQTPAMKELLEDAREAYDLVILDTPPLGLVADALPLLGQMDGVVIATFVGVSSAEDLRRLRWQISEMGGRVLGAVMSKGAAVPGYAYAGRG